VESNKIKLSPVAHAIISLYQSEYYGFCCMHRLQRKFLPKQLLEKADYWFQQQAEYASSKLQEKLADPEFKENWRLLISQGSEEKYKQIDFYLKIVAMSRKGQPLAVKAALTEDSREKRKRTFKQNKHQQGSINSQYGTMWITNEVESKKVKVGEPIPDGWRKGRKMR